MTVPGASERPRRVDRQRRRRGGRLEEARRRPRGRRAGPRPAPQGRVAAAGPVEVGSALRLGRSAPGPRRRSPRRSELDRGHRTLLASRLLPYSAPSGAGLRQDLRNSGSLRPAGASASSPELVEEPGSGVRPSGGRPCAGRCRGPRRPRSWRQAGEEAELHQLGRLRVVAARAASRASSRASRSIVGASVRRSRPRSRSTRSAAARA